jgi:hypothetical protein
MFGVLVEVFFIGMAVVGLARLARSCRSLARRLFVVVLIAVFVGFNGLIVLLACQGPGPAGCSFITGEGIPGPGQFGPTWENLTNGPTRLTINGPWRFPRS